MLALAALELRGKSLFARDEVLPAGVLPSARGATSGSVREVFRPARRARRVVNEGRVSGEPTDSRTTTVTRAASLSIAVAWVRHSEQATRVSIKSDTDFFFVPRQIRSFGLRIRSLHDAYIDSVLFLM